MSMNIKDIMNIECISGIECIEGDYLIIHHMSIDENSGIYIIPIAGVCRENTSVIVRENSVYSGEYRDLNDKHNFSMESLKCTIYIHASIMYPYGFKLVNINSKVIVNNKFDFTYVIEHGIITIKYTKYKSQ